MTAGPFSRTLHPVHSIGVREASEKYHVPAKTISNWAQDGLVRIYQKPARRGEMLLIFDADVAQLAASYVPGRGRWKRRDLLKTIA